MRLPYAFKQLAVEQTRQAITGLCRSDVGEVTLATRIVEAFEAGGWCLVPPGLPPGPEQFDGQAGG